jgi:hypothetical protein
MSGTPPSHGRRAVAAVLLVVAGLLCCALYRLTAGTEHHSYSPGAVAPSTVRLAEGRSYELSVPGGVKALAAQGADVTAPQCSYTPAGRSSSGLTVQAAGADTKATNTVATFVSPVSGVVHVDCLGWGPMFLDDAAGSAPDYAGWLLLLATISLTLGTALGVASIRAIGTDSERAAREDDEIERLVHAVHVRSEDDEVARRDGGDVVT